MIKPSDKERTITIIRDTKRIRFNFGFHPGLQEKLKELLGATFDDKEKLWSVDAKHEDRLKRAFKKFIPKGKCVDADGKPVDFRPRPPVKPELNMMQQLQKDGHIINLKGKQFVLFPGLLSLAHKHGIESITSEIIHFDGDSHTAVVQATAKGERGTFTGIGDGAPDNLSKMMVPAYLRMAETRATARALRLYLGIGMTAKDELP